MKEQFSKSKLRATRIKAGLSKEVLADRSGLDPKTISEIESGPRRPQLATVMVFAQALGVPLRTLYAEDLSG